MSPLLVFLFLFVAAQAQNCTSCTNGAQCCGDYNRCCPDGGSYICCSKDESCCFGYCCIEETTYCCTKTSTHPSRCCPRWTLCCPSGEFGCCTPAGEAWNPKMGYIEPAATAEKAAASAIVYALFVETSPLKAVTIDASTGAILNTVTVQGFDDHGEITRVFAFDERREVFYYVEADFSTDPESNLLLYTVDPVTGKSTAQHVDGSNDRFPTGYYYHCTLDSFFLATQPFDEQSTAPFTFYRVNVSTGQASFVSTSAVTGDGIYSGWFHAISEDGKQALRLGYRDVLDATGFGLGVTDISTTTASTTWQSTIAFAVNHTTYEVASIHPTSTPGTYLSLSPRTTAANPGDDLVQWSTSKATLEASLGKDSIVRGFGPIAETLSCDKNTYSAALYLKGSAPVNDRWELAVVDLVSGNVLNVNIGNLLGETNSIAGIGVPFSTQQTLFGRAKSTTS